MVKLKAQAVLRANLDKLEPYMKSLLAQVDFN